MYLPIQRGELTDRLRRFFGVVGSYRGDVDTVVAPVVQAQNLDLAPWRQDGLSWGGSSVVAAAPALNSYIEVGAPAPDLLIVEQLIINNQNAAAATFLVSPFRVAAPASGLITTELAPIAPLASADVPGGIQGGTAVIPAGGMIRVTIPAAASVTISGLSIPIQPGTVLRVWPAAVNLDISATFLGRWWRYVPLP